MSHRINLVELVELWKEEKKKYVKPSTYATYSVIAKSHLIPFLTNKKTLNESDVQKFVLSKLNSGLSQKSVKDILIVLKMIMKLGVKLKIVNYLPLDIKFPTETTQKTVPVISKANHRKLLYYVQTHPSNKNFGIYLCLSAGLRIGEICGLKWNDVDLAAGIITIRRTVQRICTDNNDFFKTAIVVNTPKTRTSNREIPITVSTMKLIRLLNEKNKPEYYILSNSLTPTEPRTYRSYYKRLLKRLEIPDIKFHSLRHSFATRCIESDCDYKTVSVLLGHSNINTTLNLYVHPNNDQKKKCLEKYSKYLY